MLEIEFAKKKDKKEWLKLKKQAVKYWDRLRQKRRKCILKKLKKQGVSEPEIKRPEKTCKKRPTRKRSSNKPKHPRVKFNETQIGHYMYAYTPVEYNMLMEYVGRMRKSKNHAPTILAEHIELLAIHTGNPAMKTVTFRKAIVAYRQYGMNPPKKAEWTLRSAVHYAKYSNLIHIQMQECARLLS